MRLTVPTCTPSRDKPLVIVSPLELGGDGLHIFVWVEAVQLVGCLGNLLRAPTLNRDYLFPLETWKGSCYTRTLPTTLALPGTLLKNKRPDPEVIASAVRECVGDEISVKDLEKRQHSNTNVFMEQCLVNSLYYIFIQT